METLIMKRSELFKKQAENLLSLVKIDVTSYKEKLIPQLKMTIGMV